MGTTPDRFRPAIRLYSCGDSIMVQGWPRNLWTRIQDSGDESPALFSGRENGVPPFFHCAYAGATIENLRLGTGSVLCGAIGAALATYPADVMLFMAGINDIVGGQTPAQTRDRLVSFLADAFAAFPAMRVTIGTCIPPNPSGIYAAQAANVIAYNALIVPAILATYFHRFIAVVDCYTGYPTVNGYIDDLHPSPTGVDWIAERFFLGPVLYQRQ